VAQSLASAAEHSVPRNSAARADLIRDAVRWLAEREAERKLINFEISEYKQKHIKGDLGFKLSDWAAIYRVSQLEIEDRDELLDTLREGFAALGIGQIVDWVDAAQATGSPSRSVSRPPPASGYAAAASSVARLLGHEDGLSGGHNNADEYPQGEPGHADYELGLADGEAERERIHGLGDDGAEAPRRGRGRPRKLQQEAEADAEF
jgi:hypothetical protein